MNSMRVQSSFPVREQVPTSCFKAYDIRGRVPDELDTGIAYRIGRALATEPQAKTIVVGRDTRLKNRCWPKH